jgi:CDP-diacylglycerol--glycerol-3-phosphate 3-phosphatidyltransferase
VVISYAKARAEGLGMTCDVGVAERPERLVISLVGIGLSGLGVPYALTTALVLLTVLSTITVIQRFVVVYRQATAEKVS